MGIEKGKVIGDNREPVDVVSLGERERYQLLRRVGPDYVLGDGMGIVIRRIPIPEIQGAVVVVDEREKQGEEIVLTTKVRQSTAVVRAIEVFVPRPGHRTLVPGIKP